LAIMLPDNLIWIMEKIGIDWPDINEDEVHKAANLTRQLRDDLEALILAVDRRVAIDLADGVRSRGGEAYVSAWNTTRSQNLQQVLDVLDPVAIGIDAAGYVVTGLKTKTIAQITIQVATLIPMLALGPLGAAAAAARMIAMKFAMGVLTDLAVSAVIDAVDEPVINALKDQVPRLVQAVLEAPLVEDTGADLGGMYFDLQVLEQASADMDQNAGDLESIVTQYLSDLAALHITE